LLLEIFLPSQIGLLVLIVSNNNLGNLYTWGIASMGSGINQET
jgi:hypothetical protein